MDQNLRSRDPQTRYIAMRRSGLITLEQSEYVAWLGYEYAANELGWVRCNWSVRQQYNCRGFHPILGTPHESAELEIGSQFATTETHAAPRLCYNVVLWAACLFREPADGELAARIARTTAGYNERWLRAEQLCRTSAAPHGPRADVMWKESVIEACRPPNTMISIYDILRNTMSGVLRRRRGAWGLP